MEGREMTPRKIPTKSGLGLTLRAAAAQAGVSIPTLRHLIKAGKIRATKRLKYWYVHPQDVAALAASEWQGNPYQPEAKKKG